MSHLSLQVKNTSSTSVSFLCLYININVNVSVCKCVSVERDKATLVKTSVCLQTTRLHVNAPRAPAGSNQRGARFTVWFGCQRARHNIRCPQGRTTQIITAHVTKFSYVHTETDVRINNNNVVEIKMRFNLNN